MTDIDAVLITLAALAVIYLGAQWLMGLDSDDDCWGR